jgi:hypothetical protein
MCRKISAATRASAAFLTLWVPTPWQMINILSPFAHISSGSHMLYPFCWHRKEVSYYPFLLYTPSGSWTAKPFLYNSTAAQALSSIENHHSHLHVSRKILHFQPFGPIRRLRRVVPPQHRLCAPSTGIVSRMARAIPMVSLGLRYS